MKCVYKITNSVTGHIYIGSAANYGSRNRTHVSQLRRKKHANIVLQRAFDKYGEAALKFSVVEEVSDSSLLLQVEQKWIDLLKLEYNICKVAGSLHGFRFSEESKKKLSACRSGIKNHNYGKPMPFEIREKLSIKGKQRDTPERRLFQRNVHKKRMQPIVQKTLDGAVVNEFECIRDAIRLTGYNRAYISLASRGKYNSKAYGFIWERKVIIG